LTTTAYPVPGADPKSRAAQFYCCVRIEKWENYSSIIKDTIMDMRAPNEDERKKLQKRAKFYSHLPIYMLGLLSLFFINNFFFDQNPILWMIIAITIVATMIFLVLSSAFLLKKCPRCSSWGTPISRGNCTKCGLHLDPFFKDHHNEI